ncbi:MAG: nucleotidyltransferase domain-containing protein [Chloroflexota bacterium]
MTETYRKVPQEQIARFCQRWQITSLALFGSILRDDFRPDSDIDVLVSFAPEARHNGLDNFQRNLRPTILLPQVISDRPHVEYIRIANRVRGWA